MKAMLLAAGRGARMRSLTDTTAKPLLKAGGTSLIDFHLNKLCSAGITDVIINVSWHADKVIEHVGDGQKYKLNISFSQEQTTLETAGGVANALPLLGSDPFLLISSDVWSDIDYRHLSQTQLADLAHLVLTDNPPHHRQGDFSLHSPLVTLRKSSRSLTYTGIGIYRPNFFEQACGKTMPLRELLIPAIEQRRISGCYHTGRWMDIGTPKRLSDLDTFLKKIRNGKD